MAGETSPVSWQAGKTENWLRARAVKLIERLWLYPPIVILLTIPLGFVSVYAVYLIWLLMPVASYTYGVRMFWRK